MKVHEPVHDGTVGSTAMTPSILTACEQLMATGQLATHRGTVFDSLPQPRHPDGASGRCDETADPSGVQAEVEAKEGVQQREAYVASLVLR